MVCTGLSTEQITLERISNTLWESKDKAYRIDADIVHEDTGIYEGTDDIYWSGVVLTHIPWGCEDDTGNKTFQERIDILKDCDFFIGLSSGVSWLAWCAKCPVVLISGFTNPYNEYYTPYRVINPMVCHGCWNDETCELPYLSKFSYKFITIVLLIQAVRCYNDMIPNKKERNSIFLI